MIPITEGTLDEWLGDYDAFNYTFRDFCFAHFRVHEIAADFVPNVTRQIHEQWVADHEQWLGEETDENTTALSHVKILALLLFNLNREPFLGNIFPHSYADEDRWGFKGSDDEKALAKKDLIDGRETVLALDFCMAVIDWFERNREDRFAPYRQPLTADMRHDLLNYLLSAAVDRKALYLILKALYLRPGAHGPAN